MANLLKIFTFCLLSTHFLFAQSDSTQKKWRNVALWTAGGYATGMTGLSVLWYSQMKSTSFHWFDDNAEWQQVDKVGHSFTTFHLSRSAYKIFQNVGVPPQKAAIWGGITGFMMLSGVEIADGFMDGYGASLGDLGANFAGSLLLTSQELLWKETRFKLKFSFLPTSLAKKRPDVLGNGFVEELIKDYNGQTHWLSVDVYAFLKKKHPKFPKWLNLAFGYGASDMLYGKVAYNNIVGYAPYRRFYVGLDFDLSYIKTKSKFLNTIIFLVDMVRLPAPTLEFSKGQWKGHFLYF